MTRQRSIKLALAAIVLAVGFVGASKQLLHAQPGTTQSVKYFASNDDCLNATLEVKFENGVAISQFKDVDPQKEKPGFITTSVGKDGMTFQFGKERCRMVVSVKPVK